MDVRLRLSDDPDGVELKQLYDWLIRDQEIHPYADISLCPSAERARSDENGENEEADEAGTSMGLALDLVQLVLDVTFNLGSLGVAILAWRQAQQPRSPVTVERDGVRVVLPPGTDLAGVQDLLRTLQDLDDEAAGHAPAGPAGEADPPSGRSDPPEPEDTPPSPEGGHR